MSKDVGVIRVSGSQLAPPGVRVDEEVVRRAEHSYASAGTYTITVRVAYTDGETAIASRQVTVSPGIVANPSFEAGTAGWNAAGSGTGVALTRIAGGYSGAWAARLRNDGTATAGCILNDAPNWLPTTAAGGRYIASLWVRSDAPGATLKLRLREYRKDDGALVGAANSAITLTTRRVRKLGCSGFAGEFCSSAGGVLSGSGRRRHVAPLLGR